MVIVVMGVLFAIILPRFTNIRTSTTLRAGRQQVISLLSSARAAALLKGKSSVLVLSATSATVWVQTGLASTWVRVAGPVRFDQSGLTLTPLNDTPYTVIYDPRGLITPVPGETLRFQLTAAGGADTVCVSRAGIIMQRGCTL